MNHRLCQMGLAVVVGVLSVSHEVKASVLEFTGNPVNTISAEGVQVPVYRQATLTVPGNPEFQKRPMYLTGAGKYVKPVAFIGVNVYIATSYVDNQSGINAADPMGSIKNSKAKVIQMTVLRGLSASQIHAAYEDSLAANDVNLEEPSIAEAMSKVNFGLNKGDVSTLIGITNANGMQSTTLEAPAGHGSSTDGPEIADTFWKVWFGVPSDSGMGNLKKALMNPLWYLQQQQSPYWEQVEFEY